MPPLSASTKPLSNGFRFELYNPSLGASLNLAVSANPIAWKRYTAVYIDIKREIVWVMGFFFVLLTTAMGSTVPREREEIGLPARLIQ